MLFGEHAVVYERPCIVTAVDRRLVVRTSLYPGNKLILNAPDVGINGYESEISRLGRNENLPKGVRFVEQSVVNFFDLYNVSSGVKIETESGFSSEFGFGSSSAVTVATIASLFEIFQMSATKKEIFDLSYKTVHNIQGLGSGFDLAAAIWGGTLYFVTEGKIIEPLEVESLPLVVGYTGIKADTPTLVRKVAELRKTNPKTIEAIFNSIEAVVDGAKMKIKGSDYVGLGELMNENHKLLKSLGVSSLELDTLVKAAREGGAYGAKLSGAGGGDCMIALVPKNRRNEVENAIEDKGGKVIKVGLNAEGLKVEK